MTIAAAPTRTASPRNIGIAGLVMGVAGVGDHAAADPGPHPGTVGDPRAPGDAGRSDRRRQRRAAHRHRRLPAGAADARPRVREHQLRRWPPEARVHLVDPGRGDAPLRHAPAVRGARRDHLRAQRRDQHRPRGHDADGRLLRHLGRRRARLVGARLPRRDARGGADGARSTRSSRSTFEPTRSSAAPASTSSRSGSPGTSSSPTTATTGRRRTSRRCRTSSCR